MKFSCTAALLILFSLLIEFSDAKGIKVGGVKIKAPKVPIAPKISMPKGPKFPVILPVPIFLPLGGGFRRLNANERVKCYVCDGDEKSLCALNPAQNARRETCPNNYYCSTVRKEFKNDEKPDATFNKTVNLTESLNSTINSESVIALVDIDKKSRESVVPEVSERNSTASSESPSSTDTEIIESGNNSSTIRSKRENSLRVHIVRGCKPLDFIDGFALAQRTDSGSNVTQPAYAQLCSSDLCNFGDGRLKCYECTGDGVDHPCMKNPTTVAKAVTCEWNEVCFVDRYTQISGNSSNSTTNNIQVSRGCRQSSLTIGEEGKITTRDSKMSLSCRLSSLCNSFDANRLVRSNAAPGAEKMPFLVIYGVLISIVLGFQG